MVREESNEWLAKRGIQRNVFSVKNQVPTNGSDNLGHKEQDTGQGRKIP